MGSCGSSESQNLVVHPCNFEGIQIVCKTWKKTYSNLFDYTASSQQINQKMLSIIDQTRIFKLYGNYQLTSYHDKDKNKDKIQGADATIDILRTNDKKNNNEEDKIFSIISRCEKTKQQPWIVVKSLPSRKYVIKEGDMLRIGKQRVRVKEIIENTDAVIEEDQQITAKGLVYQNLTKQGKPLEISESEHSNYVCRFCLDTAQTGNPLMAPCNCAGSSKYVHLRCVQTWLTKTINPRSIGKATAITWKPLVCELCGKTLPFKVYLDSKRYFTVNIPKPQRPYLVLNPLYREKQSAKSKIYLLVSFSDQKEMIIGRKSDSDIVISEDSTVSRHHSSICFQSSKNQGRFVLKDNQSKFGTLVLLRKDFQMTQELNGISIQLGGDVLQLRTAARASNKEQEHLEDLINKSKSESSEENQQAEEEVQGGPPAASQEEIEPSPVP